MKKPPPPLPAAALPSAFTVGSLVERIASDYTNGRKGNIIEIKDGRARVAWSDSPRTWVKFSALKLLRSADNVLNTTLDLNYAGGKVVLPSNWSPSMKPSSI